MTAPDGTKRPAGLASKLASAGTFVGNREQGRGWDDMLADFLAAMLLWGGIGWLVDRWLGTGPWVFIVGMVIGNFLGIYVLYLRSTAADRAAAKHAENDARDERSAR